MQIQRRKPRTAKVGLFGVGHRTYWDQFAGLKNELMGYMGELECQLRAREVEVATFGLVDDAESAWCALKEIRAAGVDLLFCDMLTYAASCTFGLLVRELNVPIVLVALQPLQAMDYSRATTHMQLAMPINGPW